MVAHMYNEVTEQDVLQVELRDNRLQEHRPLARSLKLHVTDDSRHRWRWRGLVEFGMLGKSRNISDDAMQD